ncbi:MAG: HU family DNA-binding protein [Fusobacterium sp.]|uniref:HU family DNA-binding protein n=1 Tax=Fusobacterium sp. TaxID=68766 RepID=UPI003991D969
MNREEFIKVYAEKNGLAYNEASEDIKTFFELLEEGLVKEGKVIFKGDVVFEVRHVKSRRAVNLKTKELMTTKPFKKVVAKFKREF